MDSSGTVSGVGVNVAGITVVKLTGSENWSLWKFQTKILLNGQGLFGIVDGTVKKNDSSLKPNEWEVLDAKAQIHIVSRVTENVMQHLLTCCTAAEMWSKLSCIYELKSSTSVHLLQERFMRYKYEEGGMANLFSKVEHFANQLKQLGEPVSDQMIITKVIMTLPPQYRHFVSAWESVSQESQTLNGLQARLLIEEERMKENEEPVALTVQNIKCFKCGKIGHKKNVCRSNTSCSYCKKMGHTMEQCYFKKNKEKGNSSRENKESRSKNNKGNNSHDKKGDNSKANAFISSAFVANEDSQEEWILDSGASDHITPNKNNYFSFSGISGDRYVIVGDGRKLKVQGIGQILLKAFDGTDYVETSLNDVLYVPELKATQVDNSDRYALATLSISRASGQPIGVRFRRRQYSATVSEAAAPGATLLTLHTAPPPVHMQHNNLQFYVSDRSFLDKFAINSAGEVVLRRPLDYETNDQYQYQVMVTDGVSNDTASINITVLNVNEWEPRFRYPQYEFRVDDDPHDDAELLPVGRLDVFDGDKHDTVTLTLRGSGADMLYINSSGDMFVRGAALRSLNSSVLHVVATAVDSGAPPRQTSVPVTVHLNERLLHLADPAGGAGGMLVMFAAALATLALLVCALLGYIYRVRRRSKRSGGGSGTGYVTHEKPPADPIAPTPQHAPPGGPAATPSGAAGGALRPAGSSGSLLSVSAGASTILANSTSSLDLQHDAAHGGQHHSGSSGRQSQRFPRSKVAPAPAPSVAPGVAPGGVPGAASGGAPGAVGSVSLMSDHLGARSASRSGVAWPSATIPARVKKLSWDDAASDGPLHKDRGEEVTDATNPAVAEHMNLTVYF